MKHIFSSLVDIFDFRHATQNEYQRGKKPFTTFKLFQRKNKILKTPFFLRDRKITYTSFSQSFQTMRNELNISTEKNYSRI